MGNRNSRTEVLRVVVEATAVVAAGLGTLAVLLIPVIATLLQS